MRHRHQLPLSADRLISAANTMIGLEEEREGRRGQIVELLLREVRQPMDGDWHTAFVHHVGYWAHYDHSSAWSSWPLPATGDPNDLARFAREKGIVSTDRPREGEVFLLWSPTQKEFVHAGVVLQYLTNGIHRNGAAYFVCLTLEGNTTEFAQLHGRGMHRTTRKISPDNGDRFIRWVDLDARGVSGEVTTPTEICMARMVRGDVRHLRAA
jgi:hypothetical protein